MTEHLQTFCDLILRGSESNEPFPTLRNEVQVFRDALAAAPPETLREIIGQYWSAVPNHIQACIDLDFQRFSASDPLRIGPAGLSIRRVLEAFSHTNPQRYGEVWLPILSIALATAGPEHQNALRNAYAHCDRMRTSPALPPQSPFQGVGDPSKALDGVMNNILTAFPVIFTHRGRKCSRGYRTSSPK